MRGLCEMRWIAKGLKPLAMTRAQRRGPASQVPYALEYWLHAQAGVSKVSCPKACDDFPHKAHQILNLQAAPKKGLPQRQLP